jgi:hypothetical protein
MTVPIVWYAGPQPDSAFEGPPPYGRLRIGLAAEAGAEREPALAEGSEPGFGA